MPNKDKRKRKISDVDEFNELKVKLKRLERRILRGRRRRIVSNSSDYSSVSSSPSRERSAPRSASRECARRERPRPRCRSSPSPAAAVAEDEGRRQSRECSPTPSSSRSATPAPETASPQDTRSDEHASLNKEEIPSTSADSTDPDKTVPTATPAAAANVDAELQLSGAVIEIFGEDPTVPTTYGKEIQKDLAIRFEHIATNGLSQDLRKELRDRYPVPANCKLIDAPQINLEMLAAISADDLKRLKGMEAKQKQLANAIACLGAAITFMISQNDVDHNLLKLLMDAARLVCDSQYNDSVTRRYMIVKSLKNEVKDQLLQTKIDTFLFGKDLAETLKSVKAINKSGAELKKTAPKQNTKKANNNKKNKNNLNTKTPPSRRTTGSSRQQDPAPRDQHASSSRSSRHNSNSRRSHR